MKLHSVAIALVAAMTTLSMGTAIAAEAQPQTAIAPNPNNVCRQYGAEYKEVYSFDTETHSITICQKGQQYYYVQTQKNRLGMASK